MGVGADAASTKRCSGGKRAVPSRPRHGAIPAASPDNCSIGGAVLFHPDAEAGMDDLAARSHWCAAFTSPTNIRTM